MDKSFNYQHLQQLTSPAINSLAVATQYNRQQLRIGYWRRRLKARRSHSHRIDICKIHNQQVSNCCYLIQILQFGERKTMQTCSILMCEQNVDKYVVASEESGTARCPFERTHNSTTHYTGIAYRLTLYFMLFVLLVLHTVQFYSCVSYDVVTCEIKYVRIISVFVDVRLKYFCLELFQNYFRGLLQLMDVFQHVQCR